MKKIIFTYGIISGVIVGGMMLITIPLWENGLIKFENSELVGYTTMLIALSLVFFGIKSFRDNHSNGKISFWQAAKVGMLITLVATVIYAISWEISYNTMNSNFTAEYTKRSMEKMRNEGKTEAELQKAQEEFASFAEMYKNPFIRFGMTMMEPLPVGILITLASAGLLRRKEFLPATEVVTANSKS